MPGDRDPAMTALTGTIEAGLAPAAESGSQLAMMFVVCDLGLTARRT